MPKFTEQFLSVRSLAIKYDCSLRTIRRFLNKARRAGIRVGTRKVMGATRYSETDVEHAIEKMNEQHEGLNSC